MLSDKDIKTFRDVLHIFEARSTCIRLNVAAIIIKDGRIISTGWNGVPSSCIHCKEKFKNILQDENFFIMHHKFSFENEIHAEQNAIAFAAKNGISTNNSSIFISASPCSSCAKLIISAGIKEVYYLKEYDKEDGKLAIELLKKHNINLFNIEEILNER
jgi:dCMP deaminase